MLDVSHRVETVDTSPRVNSARTPAMYLEAPRDSDESRWVDIDYRDEDDWERPTLGDQAYEPVFVPRNIHEEHMHDTCYPFPAAIIPVTPLVRAAHVSSYIIANRCN
jgi:hypothetical protein